MRDDVVMSEKGIRFTLNTVALMRDFATELRSQGIQAMCWTAIFNEKGGISVALCGDRSPQKLSIPDKVLDVNFFWLAEAQDIDIIKKFCLHIDDDGATQLLA